MQFFKERYLLTTVFVTNVSIIWVCLNLILLIIVISLSTWYTRHDTSIKFWYGGLWNECMGETDRTFCSPLTNTPGWLQVSQIFSLISLTSLFFNIIYIMVATARKKLKVSIVMVLTHITTTSLLVALIVYSVKGFSLTVKPYSSYFLAWFTVIMQLIASVLCTYSLVRVSREDKKHAIITGIRC